MKFVIAREAKDLNHNPTEIPIQAKNRSPEELLLKT
jgi:hypothetical protein